MRNSEINDLRLEAEIGTCEPEQRRDSTHSRSPAYLLVPRLLYDRGLHDIRSVCRSELAEQIRRDQEGETNIMDELSEGWATAADSSN